MHLQRANSYDAIFSDDQKKKKCITYSCIAAGCSHMVFWLTGYDFDNFEAFLTK